MHINDQWIKEGTQKGNDSFFTSVAKKPGQIYALKKKKKKKEKETGPLFYTT